MRVISLAILLMVGGCQSGYQQFYSPNPHVLAEDLSQMDLLERGEEPQLFGTDDFDRDLAVLYSKRYIVLGHSSFNGGQEDQNKAGEQAKKIGATLVLVNSQFTGTQTSTSVLFLPNNSTTYTSGTVAANTTYNNPYGGYNGTSRTTGTYSGTSNTYGTQVVPITSTQQRYDQTAVYLAKSVRKLRFGVLTEDLSPEMRVALERNTGALIGVVMEDTPAFLANLLPGDVLIAIDGNSVVGAEQGRALMLATPASSSQSIWTILRNGEQKEMHLNIGGP